MVPSQAPVFFFFLPICKSTEIVVQRMYSCISRNRGSQQRLLFEPHAKGTYIYRIYTDAPAVRIAARCRRCKQGLSFYFPARQAGHDFSSPCTGLLLLVGVRSTRARPCFFLPFSFFHYFPAGHHDEGLESLLVTCCIYNVEVRRRNIPQFLVSRNGALGSARFRWRFPRFGLLYSSTAEKNGRKG